MADGKGPPLTGLGILVDEKRVNDLITQKTGAKAMIQSGCNLALFICFMILFTLLALSEPLGDHRAFEGYVRRRFDTMAAMRLDEVESASSFWRYIDLSFMPAIYGNDTRRYYYPDYEPSKLLRIEGANRLLGVARIRTLKISPDQDCAVKDSMSPFFPTCFGAYSPQAEDSKAFGPPNQQTGDPIFMPYPADPAGTEAEGQLTTYPPGGFMEAFTANHNVTNQTLTAMKEHGWVGPGTRVIVLDWTVYNFNLGCYAVCRILFEPSPSGAWLTTFSVDVLMQRHLNPIASKSTADWLALLGELILVLFVLRYLMEEASEFVGFRGWKPYIKFDYFGDAWNLLDWLNLSLMVVTLTYRIITWGIAGDLQVYIGDPSRAGVETFTDLSGVAANVRLIHNFLAFNMVLTWFKAVKYISVLPYITTFMQTVSMSQRSLSTFVVVLGTLLFGFVLAYSVAFGEQITSFRTPWRAFVFLSRSFLGNASMSIVYESSPVVGSFLIILYVLAMMFVIVNLFYAIMISALADVKAAEDAKAGKKWEHTVAKARELWSAIEAQFQFEKRFRSTVPGLYSRMQKWKKEAAEKEVERDKECLKREMLKKPNASCNLGPGDPAKGRRPRPAANTLSVEDCLTDSDEGSEADLGPLRNKAQLSKGGMFGDAFDANAEPEELDENGLPMLMDGDEGEEPPPEAIALVVEATRHVVDGIVDRAHGARQVLLGEMEESKEILLKVGSVMEVLGRRARDLEAQQKLILKNL